MTLDMWEEREDHPMTLGAFNWNDLSSTELQASQVWDMQELRSGRTSSIQKVTSMDSSPPMNTEMMPTCLASFLWILPPVSQTGLGCSLLLLASVLLLHGEDCGAVQAPQPPAFLPTKESRRPSGAL